MSVRERIANLLAEAGVAFEEFEHYPCSSSEDSAKARKDAGAGDTIGAKAILIRVKKGGYAVVVVPGNRKLDSKKIRSVLGKHSFATPEEMAELTDGLQPGHMPPFAQQLFVGIEHLVIDPALSNINQKIGFNAGLPTASFVLNGYDYVEAFKNDSSLVNVTVENK